MAKMIDKFSISFDIEPIVKLQCNSQGCRHNMIKVGFIACNLKRVEIDDVGCCKNYEVLDDE